MEILFPLSKQSPILNVPWLICLILCLIISFIVCQPATLQVTVLLQPGAQPTQQWRNTFRLLVHLQCSQSIHAINSFHCGINHCRFNPTWVLNSHINLTVASDPTIRVTWSMFMALRTWGGLSCWMTGSPYNNIWFPPLHCKNAFLRKGMRCVYLWVRYFKALPSAACNDVGMCCQWSLCKSLTTKVRLI